MTFPSDPVADGLPASDPREDLQRFRALSKGYRTLYIQAEARGDRVTALLERALSGLYEWEVEQNVHHPFSVDGWKLIEEVEQELGVHPADVDRRKVERERLARETREQMIAAATLEGE